MCLIGIMWFVEVCFYVCTCMCVCMQHVCMCRYVCDACICVCAYMKSRKVYQGSYFIILCFICSRKAKQAPKLGCQLEKPGVRQPCPALCVGAGNQTQVPTLGKQVLFPIEPSPQPFSRRCLSPAKASDRGRRRERVGEGWRTESSCRLAL